MNINKIIKADFSVSEWSSHEVDAREFNTYLDEFMTVKIFDNFKDFLIFHDVEDAEEVLKTKTSFEEFVQGQLETVPELEVSYEDIHERVLYAAANDTTDPGHFVASCKKIKSEQNIIDFLNEAIRSAGEVTHAEGIKNKYEFDSILM